MNFGGHEQQRRGTGTQRRCVRNFGRRFGASVLMALATAALLSCGGGSSSDSGGGAPQPSGFTPTYAAAPKGTASGAETTQTIDAAGGTLTSADGGIDLTIPAGALATPTTVSIQPISNTAPNGLATAYRLTPEGTTFSQPVTITFHLPASQAAALDSTFVVSQHDDGLWYSQPQQARDATANTVSVPATHFSDWTLSQTLRLSPQQARVRTTNATTFTAQVVVLKPDDPADLANPSGDPAVAVPTPVNLNDLSIRDTISNTYREWAVNGIPWGVTAVGFINEQSDLTGIFKAPVNVPNPASEAVSLSVQFFKNDKVTTGQKVVAVAEVTIYALESWSGTSKVTMNDGTVVDATFVFTETRQDSIGTVYLNVSSGRVNAKVPAQLPNGCTQTATPTSQDIGSADGTMTALYSAKTGPDNPTVEGMGSTVWLADYTVTCANGTQSMQNGLQAEWWPAPFGAMPTPIEATDGVYINNITTATASGHVEVRRCKGDCNP